jgi:hypothetical protein
MRRIRPFLLGAIGALLMVAPAMRAAEIKLASPLPALQHSSFEEALAHIKSEARSADALEVYREGERGLLRVDGDDAQAVLLAIGASHEVLSPRGLPLDMRLNVLLRKTDGSYGDVMIVYAWQSGLSTLADVVMVDGVVFRGRSYAVGPKSMEREREGVLSEYQLGFPSAEGLIVKGILTRCARARIADGVAPKVVNPAPEAPAPR